MNFQPTITIDGVISFLSIFAACLIFVIKENAKLNAIAIKLEEQALKLEEHGIKIDKLTDVVAVQARHDERLIEIARRLNLMDQRMDQKSDKPHYGSDPAAA